MLDSIDLSLFILSSIVLIFAPGPDLLFLIAHSLNNSIRNAIALALGLASGNLVHTIAVTLGVTLALQTHKQVFLVIQYLGAAYLLYLAYKILTTTHSKKTKYQSLNNNHASFFMRGVLMNILNPKVGFFFLAFLPQFIPNDSSRPHVTMMLLGIIFTILVIIIFCSITVLTHQFKQHTFINLFHHRFFDWLSATVFIALSFHLFTNIL